jgi:hypothetical protein
VANYWTQNNQPDLSNGPTGSGQPWTSLGTCSNNSNPGTCPTNYCLIGSASELLPGNCLQITPDLGYQIGAAWNKTQIDMNLPFDYVFSVNLGSDDNGADGMTFTLQNNAAGLSALGAFGSDLGIGPLQNTFALEFDTWYNGAAYSDIAEDHIALNANGNFSTPVAGPIQASASNPNIEDGAYHDVRVVWDPVATLFTVYFDGVLRITYTNNLINSVFGGNPIVYWGFTGSTGLAKNLQTVCPGTLPGTSLPFIWGDFTAREENNSTLLNWATLSELKTNQFEVERSFNGAAFEKIGVVMSNKSSTGTNRYHFTDASAVAQIVYYRIKTKDINGFSYYSKTIMLSNFEGDQILSVYPNPVSWASDIKIVSEVPAELNLFNAHGVLIYQSHIQAGEFKLEAKTFTSTPGSYFLIVKTEGFTLHKNLTVTGN